MSELKLRPLKNMIPSKIPRLRSGWFGYAHHKLVSGPTSRRHRPRTYFPATEIAFATAPMVYKRIDIEEIGERDMKWGNRIRWMVLSMICAGLTFWDCGAGGEPCGVAVRGAGAYAAVHGGYCERQGIRLCPCEGEGSVDSLDEFVREPSFHSFQG
jgi:hypothetical protein